MSEQEEKARNREIAENEEKRKDIGAVRVSSWAIVIAIVVALIVFELVWPWIRPR
jgi:uncharacterized membrane protein YvbJ